MTNQNDPSPENFFYPVAFSYNNNNNNNNNNNVQVKLNQSRYRPGVAQRVPGS